MNDSWIAVWMLCQISPSGGREGVWPSWPPLRHPRAVYSVALSPDQHLTSHPFSATSGDIGVWRLEDTQLPLRLLAREGRDVGIVVTGSGEYFDLSGADTAWARGEGLVCWIGPLSLPLELCEERTHIPGLLGRTFARDPTLFEP